MPQLGRKSQLERRSSLPVHGFALPCDERAVSHSRPRTLRMPHTNSLLPGAGKRIKRISRILGLNGTCGGGDLRGAPPPAGKGFQQSRGVLIHAATQTSQVGPIARAVLSDGLGMCAESKPRVPWVPMARTGPYHCGRRSRPNEPMDPNRRPVRRCGVGLEPRGLRPQSYGGG